MPKINSKKKGNKAERVVAGLFTTWTDIKFYRTPASGGLHWHNRPDVMGDLTSETPVPFTVEVKSRKEIDLDFMKEHNDIYKFWDQAKSDAKEANKIPLLLFRYNGLKKDLYYVAIKLTLFNKIKFTGIDYEKYLKMYRQSGDNLAIIPSDLFFTVPYTKFKKALK